MWFLVCCKKHSQIAPNNSLRKGQFPKDNMDIASGFGGYVFISMDAVLIMNAKEWSH